MKQRNFYERVIKPRTAIIQNPAFSAWAKKKKLTRQQITRAADALLNGRSSFQD